MSIDLKRVTTIQSATTDETETEFKIFNSHRIGTAH